MTLCFTLHKRARVHQMRTVETTQTHRNRA
jgi:hypothetical protein